LQNSNQVNVPNAITSNSSNRTNASLTNNIFSYSGAPGAQSVISNASMPL